MSLDPSLDPNPSELLELLRSVAPFSELTNDERASLVRLMRRRSYPKDAVVFEEGAPGASVYIVQRGELDLEVMGRRVHHYREGEVFGEVAALDDKPRMGTVTARTDSVLIELAGQELREGVGIDPAVALKIVRAFGRRIASYVRASSAFYERMDVLLVQDGGCAPGYNPVTAFLCQYLENDGRQVFIGAEGFRSLARGGPEDFRCLIHDAALVQEFDHIPGVVRAAPLRDARGADFRSERYPEFKEPEPQKRAARTIRERGVRMLVGIGGNGTFAGLKALCRFLPATTSVFFVPVTIDSDIHGTECIGQHTGVEIGAEKIRSYLADARTHHRCYIIEMMGAEGGYHALNACLGAGADLAVLPGSEVSAPRVATALTTRRSAVIVVAEGYKRDERRAARFEGNAAEFFRDELVATGVEIPSRIVCEAFSRDIRGAAPNNVDIALAQRMASEVAALARKGDSQKMPAVRADEVYAIPFEEIRTDNAVHSGLARLANQLDEPSSGEAATGDENRV